MTEKSALEHHRLDILLASQFCPNETILEQDIHNR